METVVKRLIVLSNKCCRKEDKSNVTNYYYDLLNSSCSIEAHSVKNRKTSYNWREIALLIPMQLLYFPIFTLPTLPLIEHQNINTKIRFFHFTL